MNRPMTISYATDDGYKYMSGIYTGKQKPMLRIANRFLLASGFTVGSKIEVKYEDNILIITLKTQ